MLKHSTDEDYALEVAFRNVLVEHSERPMYLVEDWQRHTRHQPLHIGRARSHR